MFYLNTYIFTLNEIFLNGYKLEFIYYLFIYSILSGILVIISKNPIISVIFLIALFFGASTYLIILGLNFIGISYLLVYIGAISILFLFILMLINIRVSELIDITYNNLPLAIIIGILFSYYLYNNYYNYKFLNNIFIENYNIMMVISKIWDYNLIENSHAAVIGNIIYTNYSIWIIIISLLLLLAMIGTLCLVID